MFKLIIPGKTLEAELKARGISARALAIKIMVPANRITLIIRGKRAITAETAWLLGHAFGTSPEFWMRLQTNYDLALARIKLGDVIIKEVAVHD